MSAEPERLESPVCVMSLEAQGFKLLSLMLSEPNFQSFWISDTKLNKTKTKTVDQILEGAHACCAPAWIHPPGGGGGGYSPNMVNGGVPLKWVTFSQKNP